MIFLKISSTKNFAKKLAFFTQTTYLQLVFYKNVIIIVVFDQNANSFRRKLAKIADYCDHNIDPWGPMFLF
jgi:hypothetical protein